MENYNQFTIWASNYLYKLYCVCLKYVSARTMSIANISKRQMTEEGDQASAVVLLQSDISGTINAQQLCYPGMGAAGKHLELRVARF